MIGSWLPNLSRVVVRSTRTVHAVGSDSAPKKDKGYSGTYSVLVFLQGPSEVLPFVRFPPLLEKERAPMDYGVVSEICGIPWVTVL